jgi:protein-S-isoprenylcysteine O-methyltransferase Ste14
MRLLYGPLIGLIWMAWCLYWYVAARNVKAARRTESRSSWVTHTVLLVAAIALLAWPQQGDGWFFGKVLPQTILGYWIGVALLLTGLGFSIWARRRLGRNWSGTVTLKEDHELVRTGPYRWVRHPIYSGLLLGFVGTAISLSEWRGVAAVILAIFALLLKIRLEERWMIETFGNAYLRFRAEVKALIPFVL